MDEFSYQDATGWQSGHNMAKAGQYRTPNDLARKLGELGIIKPPEDDLEWKEHCIRVCDPSSAEFDAADAFLEGLLKNSAVPVQDSAAFDRYACEMNHTSVEVMKARGDIHVLEGDTTQDMSWTPGSMDLAFCNPPYMDEAGADSSGLADRMEMKFVDLISGGAGKTGMLRKGGVMALVLSHRIFSDKRMLRRLYSRFTEVGVWRFPEKEYKAFKQIISLWVKRDSNVSVSSEELEGLVAKFSDPENIPELPDSFGELTGSVAIPVSERKRITFAMKEYDFDEGAMAFACGDFDTGAVFDFEDGKATQPKVAGLIKPTAPIPVSQSLCYSMASSGFSNGLVGTEGEDLHTQCCYTERVTSTHLEKDSKTGEMVVVEDTKNVIGANIIKNYYGPNGEPVMEIDHLSTRTDADADIVLDEEEDEDEEEAA